MYILFTILLSSLALANPMANLKPCLIELPTVNQVGPVSVNASLIMSMQESSINTQVNVWQGAIIYTSLSQKQIRDKITQECGQ